MITHIFSSQEKYEIVIENFADNAHYEGEKIDDKRSGKGKMSYSNGSFYEGYWRNDFKDGDGVYYNSSGHEIYRGIWKNNQYNEKGRLYNQNIKDLKEEFNYLDFDNIDDFWIFYEGDFKDGVKEGIGSLLLSNGEKIEGIWKENRLNGRARFYKSNGGVVEGIWLDNRMEK